MEITALNKNISFYFNSRAVYCDCEILEKKITDTNSPYLNNFNVLQKGHKINLKYTGDQPEKILSTLTNRLIRVQITATELPQDTRYSSALKYLFDKAEVCSTSTECS